MAQECSENQVAKLTMPMVGGSVPVAPAGGAWYYYGGGTAELSWSGDSDAGLNMISCVITIPASKKITKIAVKFADDPGGAMKLSLFDNTGGTTSMAPIAGGSVTVAEGDVGTGWVEGTLATPIENGATTSYRVGFIRETTGANLYYLIGGSEYYKTGVTYAIFPETYGSLDTAGVAPAVRIYVEDL